MQYVRLSLEVQTVFLTEKSRRQITAAHKRVPHSPLSTDIPPTFNLAGKSPLFIILAAQKPVA
jgi:hypothetical protein